MAVVEALIVSMHYNCRLHLATRDEAGLPMILNLFPQRPDHPLADGKELKRIVAELLVERPGNAVDEVTSWFESLKHARNFRVDHYFDVLRRLDEAAQPHLRRLARDYIQSRHLSPAEKSRIWTRCHGFWNEVAASYSLCLARARLDPRRKGSDALKASLPLAEARLLAARRCQLKWLAYRYAAAGPELWQALGASYLAAEQAGYAQKSVQLYPGQHGLSNVQQQYTHALVFCLSSMDGLLPEQIELADRLIAHFLPAFVLFPAPRPDSVYWVDAGSGEPPTRLARRPVAVAASLRYLSPVPALAALNELTHRLEHGDLPADLNLGGEYPPKLVLTVLRHLRPYWAQQPPQREHRRHPIRTQMTVLEGFEQCYMVFAGATLQLQGDPARQQWLVDNISLGGFRALLDGSSEGRVRLGALLCMQAEGSDNWLLGVVRRLGALPGGVATVGVQVLSRRARSVDLRPRRSGFAAAVAIPGICLYDEHGAAADVLRILLPLGGFQVRENLDLNLDGGLSVLVPLEVEESGGDFEIARFRRERVG
ncbi:hypothetical protein [Accumulibacter sp.]|uniref:hypothetical protein n=1 Tax=Accumulibacter sp. TaxID=2053492 RepID=UPI0025797C87|nr:hypothetical protein [Accumulibacter sp.]